MGLIGVVTPSAQEELGGIGIIGGDDLVKCIQDEVNALKDESVDTIAVIVYGQNDFPGMYNGYLD